MAAKESTTGARSPTNPPCPQELWQKGWEEELDREVQAVALFYRSLLSAS